MRRTPEQLAELHELKKKHGKRFYVAAHVPFGWGLGCGPRLRAVLIQVDATEVHGGGTPLDYAVKYFKAQHNQREMYLATACCHVSRYGSVSYGGWELVKHECNQ